MTQLDPQTRDTFPVSNNEATSKPAKRRPRSRNTIASGVGFEPLESRLVLSATLRAPSAAPLFETAQDPIIIEAVHLRVGNETVTVKDRGDVVIYEEGMELDIVAIDYAVSTEGAGLDGVLATESYLRHGDIQGNLGDFDYANGRFGRASDQAAITDGVFQMSEEDSPWTMEETANRVAVTLVRYFDASWEVHDRFMINLQPGQTDLVLLGGVYGWSSRGLEIGGYVANRGDRAIRTDAEINIYDPDDLTRPVWVGTFSATVEPGRMTFARFANDANDDFDTVWKPSREGKYVVKIYLDPEDAIREVNEENNFIESTIKVKYRADDLDDERGNNRNDD